MEMQQEESEGHAVAAVAAVPIVEGGAAGQDLLPSVASQATAEVVRQQHQNIHQG
jgi:hypothetical protein